MNRPETAFVSPRGAATPVTMAATSVGYGSGSQVDAREAGRLVASVILAARTGTSAELVEQANRGLVRLGLLPLAERDFVVTTPEELAPLMPQPLRGALADLLLELSAGEPLRRRMADAYLALWNLRSP